MVSYDGTVRVSDDFMSPTFFELVRDQVQTEVFEWEDLRAAVNTASETFTIVELGAGYGRWSVAGVTMALAQEIPAKAIAVEAEPDHFRWLRAHFINNGLDPDAHRLIEAAVTDSDREVWFVQGHASDWYGQAILPSRDHGYGPWPNATVVAMRGVSLATVIGDAPLVDLLHMDVQGEEAAVLRGNGQLLDDRVKCAHIATHNPDVEAELRVLFRGLRWQCRHDFASGADVDTERGRMRFTDGIQSWTNPRYG